MIRFIRDLESLFTYILSGENCVDIRNPYQRVKLCIVVGNHVQNNDNLNHVIITIKYDNGNKNSKNKDKIEKTSHFLHGVKCNQNDCHFREGQSKGNKTIKHYEAKNNIENERTKNSNVQQSNKNNKN